jgi:hypothetical protein
MYQTTHYIYRLLLTCCLLAQLANCKQYGRNNPEEPSSSTSNAGSASDTNNGGGTPLSPNTDITEEMIKEVIDAKNINPTQGYELLENVLEGLAKGKKTTINDQTSDGYTALHLAVELNKVSKVSIIKVLLDENADVNLKLSDSLTPFHLALLTDNLDVALLLLKSKKITTANLEAAVVHGDTALTLAQEEVKKANTKQAEWQAIIKELQDQGINK